MADRVTVAEAASILCVSVDAVRKRLQRGTLAGGKEGNTWYVLLRQDADRTPTGHSQERPDAFGQPARETAGGAGHRQDADRTPRQDVDRTRQDVSGELLDGDPVLRAAVLATETNAKLGRGETLPQKIAGASRGEARVQAAAIVGTNRQYVSDAKRIAERGMTQRSLFAGIDAKKL